CWRRCSAGPVKARTAVRRSATIEAGAENATSVSGYGGSPSGSRLLRHSGAVSAAGRSRLMRARGSAVARQRNVRARRDGHREAEDGTVTIWANDLGTQPQPPPTASHARPTSSNEKLRTRRIAAKSPASAV